MTNYIIVKFDEGDELAFPVDSIQQIRAASAVLSSLGVDSAPIWGPTRAKPQFDAPTGGHVYAYSEA